MIKIIIVNIIYNLFSISEKEYFFRISHTYFWIRICVGPNISFYIDYVCIFFENFGRPIKPKSNAMKYEDKALDSGLKNEKIVQ